MSSIRQEINLDKSDGPMLVSRHVFCGHHVFESKLHGRGKGGLFQEMPVLRKRLKRFHSIFT